jgi:predicted TIM-barrel fold metal-dependent hydrolase
LRHDDTGDRYWLIDGKIRGLAGASFNQKRATELSQLANRQMVTPTASQQMQDVKARLAHMDELGVDMQILLPTIFIQETADRPEVDIPICRSFNRWMADIWQQGEGRLRWIMVPPMLDIAEAINEIRFAKENGACGVWISGLEGERVVSDPYFFPVYEEAQRQDMPMIVHVSNKNPNYVDLVRQYDVTGAFWIFRVSVFCAFYKVVMADLPLKFPALRWGFIEAGAQWLPLLAHDLKRRFPTEKRRELPDDFVKQYRLYLSCQTDDDLPYILKYSGEDNIVCGTDYGHTDPSSDINALHELAARTDVSQEVVRKILDDNARALYGL